MKEKDEVIEKLIKAKNLIIEANEIATSNGILEDTIILNASCDIDEALGELGVELTISNEYHKKIIGIIGVMKVTIIQSITGIIILALGVFTLTLAINASDLAVLSLQDGYQYFSTSIIQSGIFIVNATVYITTAILIFMVASLRVEIKKIREILEKK